MKRVFVAVLAAFLLSGCPQGTVKTITLPPISMSGSYQREYWTDAWCYVPFGQGFFGDGLEPQSVGLGELYSGFEDHFLPGANPFPCNEQLQTLYRGQVDFDLGQFDSIIGATLTFDVETSLSENGGSNTSVPPVS
jgi:hypothetical protein